MHTLTGGWNRDAGRSTGKHWTLYTQKNNGGMVYATIELTGYARESALGDYNSAYVKPSRSVDYYHPHNHGGGMT